MGKIDSRQVDQHIWADNHLYRDLLRSSVFAILGMSLIFILISSLFFHELLYRSAVTGGIAIFVGLIALWMIPRGYVRLAGILLISLIWLAVAYLSYTGGGIGAPIFGGNVILVILASIFFGQMGGLWVALASLAYGVFLAVLESKGLLQPGLTYSPFARVFIFSFIFTLAFLLQRAALRQTASAMQRAQTSELQYQLLLENIPIITYINDLSPESRTTYVSPQVERVLGYTQKELLDDPLLWRKIIAEEDRDEVLAENERTSKTLEPFDIEYRILAKDNVLIWVHDEAILVYDENGKPQYWLGVWTDITAAKNFEKVQAGALEALTKRTSQLQAAGEVSRAVSSILELDVLLPKVVELIRSHFNYYYVGLFLVEENFEKLILRAGTGEMGQQILAAQHSFEIGNSSLVGWSVANNQARIAIDAGQDALSFRNPILPLTRSELALPLRARGKVIGAMTFQSRWDSAFTETDITALQTMADQVANAVENARLFDDRTKLITELERKNAELEEFAYTVSHDLKSPLVTMRGFLGYLAKDAHAGDLTRFDKDLKRVVEATTRMQALLSDLLELSKIGRIDDKNEEIDFAALTRESFHLVVSADENHKDLLEINEPMPHIFSSRVRMEQLAQNLLGNALKFMGEQSSPKIKVGTAGIDPRSSYPIFFVSDNGIGIEPKFHDQVFGLFNRLHPEMDGTGVGLTLVKRIVELQGGRIWIDSIGENRGTTFYFTLPPANLHDE